MAKYLYYNPYIVRAKDANGSVKIYKYQCIPKRGQYDPDVFGDAGCIYVTDNDLFTTHLRRLQFDRVLHPGEALYKLSRSGPGILPSPNVQDYDKLRKECLSKEQLFEDPRFPAVDDSLFYSPHPSGSIEWKRPKEITDPSQFIGKDSVRFDVQQGKFSSGGLLQALLNLTMHSELFLQTVPEDQNFADNYTGIFHFRFWKHGKWIEVVIDDLLPTCNGQLMYLHSTEGNEFWSALLEKAYAKLHGSYEALEGITTFEAIEDLTGSVTDSYEIEDSPSDLFTIFLKAYERNSLFGASIKSDSNYVEAVTPEGLIQGLLYGITCVKYVDISEPNQTKKMSLLRLQNSRDTKAKWNGPWSEQSVEWKSLDDPKKIELGITLDKDGEFWMEFQDFKRFFTRLQIHHFDPSYMIKDDLNGGKKKWAMDYREGEWVRGITAGGCKKFRDTFWYNPQYLINLKIPDDGDDKCTIIVALMQKKNRGRVGANNIKIGFTVYGLDYHESLPKPLDMNFFGNNEPVAQSPSFTNDREVSCRFKLPLGTYCIVPSTFDPNEEGEFLLRIFTENLHKMNNNDGSDVMAKIDETEVDQSQSDSTEEMMIREVFDKSVGDYIDVDCKELKEILDYLVPKELNCEVFSKDICRSILAMVEVNYSGKFGFEQFMTLWNDIKKWTAAFQLYDTERTGQLSPFHLRRVLKTAGFRLNNDMLNLLGRKYGTRDGSIKFEDYIMGVLRVKMMINTIVYLHEWEFYRSAFIDFMYV